MLTNKQKSLYLKEAFRIFSIKKMDSKNRQKKDDICVDKEIDYIERCLDDMGGKKLRTTTTNNCGWRKRGGKTNLEIKRLDRKIKRSFE